MWTVDRAILVHEVLMKFLISRNADEPFYQAEFVHDADEAMQELDWIEWCGDGWRITDQGEAFFLRMDAHLSKIWDEANCQLGRGRPIMAGTCKIEGCNKPRHVGISGNEFTYCHEHQREKWAEAKRESYKEEKKAKATPKREEKSPRPRATQPLVKANGPWLDGEPKSNRTVATDPPIGKVIEVLPKQVGDEFAHVVAALTPLKHDCDQCEAKAVVEALRAKSPKLAKLIDAMQAEMEALAELGI